MGSVPVAESRQYEKSLEEAQTQKPEDSVHEKVELDRQPSVPTLEGAANSSDNNLTLGELNSAEQDVFKDAALSQEQIDRYSRFAEYYTEKEYVTLCGTAASISAEPQKPINSKLIVVRQDNSTYNSINTKYLIMNLDGVIIKKYADNGWGPNVYNVADFAFVNSYDNYEGRPSSHSYELDYYDIYNSDGNVVGVFQAEGTIDFVKDLGDGYTLFNYQWNRLAIIDAEGSCAALSYPARDYAPNVMFGLTEQRINIGKLSEGLFAIWYRGIDVDAGEYFAMYYTTNGEVAIDLSNAVTNFDVYELGDFENGVALIRFIGANGKDYTGEIDCHGEFISEPISVN